MDNQRTEKWKRVWKKTVNFWYYHKWKVLLVLFLTALGVYGISTALAQKELAFSGVMINCYSQKESTLAEDFARYEQIDTDTYDVLLEDNVVLAENYTQGNMMVLQSLLARVNAGELDILAADTDVFRLYANATSGILADVRDYLDEEALTALSGQIYYIDRAFLSVLQEAVGSEEAYKALEYPDPHRPEEMTEPVPVGIDISNCPKIQAAYNLGESPLYLGIIANTQRPETVAHFIEFLFDQQ